MGGDQQSDHNHNTKFKKSFSPARELERSQENLQRLIIANKSASFNSLIFVKFFKKKRKPPRHTPLSLERDPLMLEPGFPLATPSTLNLERSNGTNPLDQLPCLWTTITTRVPIGLEVSI